MSAARHRPENGVSAYVNEREDGGAQLRGRSPQPIDEPRCDRESRSRAWPLTAIDADLADRSDTYGVPPDRSRLFVRLTRDSLTPAQLDPSGCQVIAGDWVSVYDGQTASDPGRLKVDHVVALKEAWDSGAFDWDPSRRAAYANHLDDPRTLRAVTGTSNSFKGAADPSNWMPSEEADWCGYLGDWISIKAPWQLTLDQSEAGRIRNLLTERCPDQLVPA